MPFIFENLKSVKIDKLNRIGDELNGFCLTVQRRDLWEKELPMLIPTFGKLLFEEYEQEKFIPGDKEIEERTLKQLQITFARANKVIVIASKGDIVGFLSLAYEAKSRNVGNVLEIFVNPHFRNLGFGNKLYELMFANADVRAVIAYTKNPATVQSCLRGGLKYGYRSYFGDQGADMSEMIKLEALEQESLVDDGLKSNAPAPYGFAYLKGDENINIPLQKGEARFGPDSPIGKQFDKILVLQAENPRDTAVGILISIKS